MSGSKPKVLVAMSGGVDSSVASALLVRQGYEVVGCFMRLGSPGETLEGLAPIDESCTAGPEAGGEDPKRRTTPLRIAHRGCCSVGDAADARAVAAELGIPFYVCNFKREFNRIIDYFVDEYAQGRTPNPCVRCNDWLKFGKLHEYAQQIGADFVASGHYARIAHGASPGWRDGEDLGVPPTDLPLGAPQSINRSEQRLVPRAHGQNARLLRGIDHTKDQSYVLFGVPRSRLDHMLLPIGALQKTRVREMARKFGLPVFDKPDSQEICFVPDDDYAGLVERRSPGVAQEGEILDRAGHVVGQHAGQHRFTIGQRRGVGVSLGHPIYVIDKDPAANTITVGEQDDLLVRSCVAGESNWLVDIARFADWTPCLAKYRYNTPSACARVRTIADLDVSAPSGRVGAFEVVFDEPQRAVAPGQALVIYDADQVLGGGWIARCDGDE